MEYSPVDPRKYGVNIVPEPQQTLRKDTNAIEARQPRLPMDSGTPFSVFQTSPPSQHQCEVEGSAHESNENIPIELPSTRQLSQSSPADVPVVSPPLMANDPQVNATNTSEREARKKIQKEKRAELQRAKRLQRWREHIARELGCDVTSIDSDQEREYMRRRLEDITAEENAERERRQGLSSEERRQEDIQASAERLKRHMETYLGQYARLPYPAFLLQEAPQSRNGAKCQLRLCEKRIMPDDYRIAVDPGDKYHWIKSPDFYHIHCFEELLDLSSPMYASRFMPDMKYFPGSMELHILKEYIRRWMIRTGTKEPTFPEYTWGPSTDDINPERYFLSETDLNYNERHSLSCALKNWRQGLSEIHQNE